jgi:hypothetical protein
VAGPSGVGKSSFVRDGLIPRLRAAPAACLVLRGGEARLLTAVEDRREDLLVLGFAEGGVLARDLGGDSSDGLELRGTPRSSVAVIEEGPLGTLIVGYGSGFVGLWDVSTGTLLSSLRRHGVVTDVAYEGDVLVAASDLGDRAALDLSVLERPYCDLLHEVWEELRFEWRNSGVSPADLPDAHPCRR